MKKWALIVGGSSGIGLASAKKLGKEGYNLVIIHRDRKSVMEPFQTEMDGIRAHGAKVVTYNFDAVNPEKINAHILEISKETASEKISLMLHAVSRGNLKSVNPKENVYLSDQDIHLTLDAMAVNLLTWSRALIQADLFARRARIVALTSIGSSKYWSGYAAVGMAKAALETLTKYMAVEFAPLDIRVNTIHAGVTDTPSLQMIPNYEALKNVTLQNNPLKRMTQPEDVANVVYLLSLPEADWVNGSILHVDGGEHFM